jgi:TonB family protein
MKRNLSILLLAVILLVAQVCGTKSETNEAANTAETTVQQVKADEAVRAERRATLEKDRLAREEQRRIALEERVKTSQFYTNADGKIVYNKAEVDPSFVGGQNALIKYLNDNLQFPQEAKDKGLEGTVFVDFVVTENGMVREVEVTEETNEEVDQSFRTEAIRVVTSMPNWTPGRQRGKAVDVKYSLPITFQMI